MQKKEALSIIVKCAEQYRNNLENKNLLFVFGDKQIKSQFEAMFVGSSYLHLTGVILTSRKQIPTAGEFYRACLDNRLRETDFKLADNGTTELKLDILMGLMNIHNTAKMVGEYNFSKTLLYTEKIAGNIFGCMGFIREGEFYIPNTVLKEDIRDITEKPQKRVLAILSKNILEKEYKTVTYLAKGISADMLGLLQTEQCSKVAEKEDTNRKPLDVQLHEAKEQYEKNVPERVNKGLKKEERVK